MKYAILGDIHSNWEALSVVLRDAEEQGVTAYVCVGDMVGYNPDPMTCLQRIRELDCIAVRGNHDHFCIHESRRDDLSEIAAAALAWTRSRLDDGQVRYLRDLPTSRILEDFAIVHNTLCATEQWGYVLSAAEAELHFSLQATQVCFHGHTHVPILFEEREHVTMRSYNGLKITPGRKYFINVGSVGQPRDKDPRAAYVVYDVDRKKVELRRLPYDVTKTQEKIWSTDLPDWLGVRLQFGI